MANINKDNAYMEFPLQIKRQYAAPIDFNEVWYDLEALKAYAKSGATSYTGQTVKFIDESKENAITVYTIGADGSLITSGVNDGNIEQWNDTYRKAETDQRIKAAKDEVTNKINEMEKGRVWKPSVDNFAAIATTYPEPQDTWTVITRDDNKMWIYDAQQTKWVDLGNSVIHDNATPDKDGLMSKEDKKKVDAMETKIATAKQEAIADAQTKDTALEDKITKAYKDADAVIDQKVTAMDTAYKQADTEIRQAFAAADTALEKKLTTSYTEAISAAKTEITEAYTAADTALEGKITKAYQAVDTAIRGEFAAADKVIDGKVTALTQTHSTDKAALEKKIQDVDAKFVAASEEQINALFS